MDSSAAVQFGAKNHFIEHKQAYTAAAVTVLALAIIASIIGTLALLATKGVSLGFLTSLRDMGSIGSISMLSAGGALTFSTIIAFALLTILKKEHTTATPTSETESITQVGDELSDEEFNSLTIFLKNGEYMKFKERTCKIEGVEDKYTWQARYTEEDKVGKYTWLALFTDYEFSFFKREYTDYKFVSIETLRSRKIQAATTNEI